MKARWLILPALAVTVACGKEVPEPELPEPVVHTIVAGFDGDAETRSRLSFGESAATVLWTAGDAFKMVRMNESNYSSATYTTQDDGVTKATFTSNKTLTGSSFSCGYPASVYRVGRKDEMGCLLITPVPSEQEAVPGGLAEGLNRAAAWTDRPDGDLTFHNLLAIIRFRMDGALVSSLSSVTFDAGTTVAGDATVNVEGGEPVIDFSKNWANPTFARSSSITLTGPFTAGQDYCMALVPVEMKSGFNMIFRDAEGHSILKHSSKSLKLSRSRSFDFGTIHLGDTWETEKPETIEYVHQTKGSQKNVISVLADGFMADELDQFEILAKSAVDYLFSVEPFKSYKEYFTVYLHRVASNESGGGVLDDNGNVVTAVDNYFGSRWSESSYGNMTANSSTIQSYLNSHVPEIAAGELTYKDVPCVLLINDHRYGGICHNSGSGWAYCQVPYQHAGGSMRWSFPAYQAVNPMDDSEGYRETTDEERDEMGRNVGDWRNTFLHEFGGHGFGRLTDEYWKTSSEAGPGAVSGHSWSVPYSLNVSGFYDAAPWKQDLLDQLDEWTGINPDYGRIGRYQGGKSSLYFRWRSEMTSCMIDNRPYFNTWSRILIVRRILEKAGETFDMDEFRAKDVTTDPIRPAPTASAAARAQARERALMVPEMPMLPPPVYHEDE